ncbi:DNA end-binding protein Ku [Kribbella amoyensis]|uniref:Non-homologous end joining protein Ku n=1 Tax=Kribbella amoyensis TaxID=996641 RepID=A0A561BRC1_9ACTN|nr:Ku protein [Kribbella amoyensis]TWD81448.1 DNA end-binding protein Ku [Kribbella amoyensis]
MARAIWNGYINFGLVSVPVGMYSATEEHEVDFHQFQRGTSDRIRYKRVNERTGREVEYDDIVKGHDVGGGEYVIVEREELDEIAPGKSRSLQIDTFVDLDEIDPIYFQKTYYLGPADQENASSYGLLRDALDKTNRAGIATFVMRGKEYLASIRADGKVLVLETMYFADEIRDPAKELGDLPKAGSGKQLKMAADLVEAMSGPWRPKDYRDSYTDRVKKLVESKHKGEEIVSTEEEPEATAPTDLVSALRASVEAARARRSGGQQTGAKKTSAKKAATKKTAAKKSTAKKSAAKKAGTKKTATKKTAAKKTARKSAAKKKAA